MTAGTKVLAGIAKVCRPKFIKYLVDVPFFGSSTLVKTIYGSSWGKMKEYKFKFDKATLKAKLFDDK